MSATLAFRIMEHESWTDDIVNCGHITTRWMIASSAIYNWDTNIVAMIQPTVGRVWLHSQIKGSLLMAHPRRRSVPEIGFYFDTKTEATGSCFK